ncbi:MFS transporter [Streptomyces sp. NPDC091272]|uniref:MFS transporter n=1 Tax=Streptomyces sp. NPDC091272 TaxID=3365981 RepID=UPI0037F2FC91
MTRRMTLLLALTGAVAVGNLYFPQAVVPLLAEGLHVTPGAAASVVTATQVGYTLGMFLLVPLGDRYPRRTLLVVLLTLTGLSLLAAAAAPTLTLLAVAAACSGLTTIAAPVLGPLASALTPVDRRGEVLGTLASGTIGGMLLARTFGGSLGEMLGWRAPYLAAAVLTLALAACLARTLPDTEPPAPQRYSTLLTSTLRLLPTTSELRRSCLYQATVFAGFSALWAVVPLLLTGPRYHLTAHATGLLALVGAATMLCTPLAGRLVDRRGPDTVNLLCLLTVLLAAAVLLAGGYGGLPGLGALTLGTLLLDVAMQAGMVANTHRLYTLHPDFHSRLITAYMTCAYLGGSAGSWLGVRTFEHYGWWSVCVVVALLAALATTHLRTRPRAHTQPSGATASDPAAR